MPADSTQNGRMWKVAVTGRRFSASIARKTPPATPVSNRASWVPIRNSSLQEAIEVICVNECTINLKEVVGRNRNACAP
jgi:hypothetical protein